MADLPVVDPYAQLPDEPAPASWLARNRKTAILVGIVVVVGAVLVSLLARQPDVTPAATTNRGVNQAVTNTPTNRANGTSFRRYTIVNAIPQGPLNVNTATTADLQRAIQNLQSQTSTK